eukprot:2845711-Rhodomonas_salina.1
MLARQTVEVRRSLARAAGCHGELPSHCRSASGPPAGTQPDSESELQVTRTRTGTGTHAPGLGLRLRVGVGMAQGN